MTAKITAIINATPSRSTVDAALLGPVRYGDVVDVPDDGERDALVASGHFLLANKTNTEAVEAVLAAEAKRAAEEAGITEGEQA